MKKKLDIKKLVLLNLPYVFAFYFVDKLAAVFRLAPGTEFIDKLTGGFANFGAAFANPLPSFHPVDLLIGVAGGALLKLAVYIKGKNRKKFRQGEEYGSARWGRPEDIRPYMDDDFSNNVILTQTEGLTMNSRPKQPKYARNKNILVIGGSGSGKTRFFVKPNLMQMHSSYVVTDPKGTVLVECGKMLEKNGYIIKSLNTINFRKSMHYNPFAYIRSEKDILKLVNTIIVNTKGDGDKSGEDFWVKAEKLYYTALIGYIWYEAPEHEKNFTTLLELINASEAREDDETFKNPVDLMFDELEERDPDHFAVKQYRKYKLAAGVVCSKRLLNQAVGKSLRTHNLKPKKGAQVMRKNEKITALYLQIEKCLHGVIDLLGVADDILNTASGSVSSIRPSNDSSAGCTGLACSNSHAVRGCGSRRNDELVSADAERNAILIRRKAIIGKDIVAVSQSCGVVRAVPSKLDILRLAGSFRHKAGNTERRHTVNQYIVIGKYHCP